jgi:hypothetical protein
MNPGVLSYRGASWLSACGAGIVKCDGQLGPLLTSGLVFQHWHQFVRSNTIIIHDEGDLRH